MFIILSILIFIISLVNLFLFKREPYSLHKIINLFFLFFYSVAPVTQFKNNIMLWGGNIPFTQTDYENTSFVILICLVLYNFLYALFRYRFKSEYREITYVVNKPFNTLEMLKLIGISVAIFFVVLYMNNFSLISVLVRSGEHTNRIELDKSMALIINTFLRPIPVIIVAFIGLCGFSRTFFNYFIFAFLLVIAFLTVAPTAIARFMIAAIYLPLIFVYFQKTMRRKNIFILTMVIGLLIIFPFLNNFRNFADNTSFSLAFNYDMFSQGHFDAYSIFLRVLKLDIITYGKQLLAPLFFYIPRTWWPTKPFGTGHTIAHQYNLDFDNISCPYLAEGFVNFGYLGVFVFIIVLALLSCRLDIWYWTKLSSIHKIQYYMLLGLFFFMMRGDLLSTTSFTIGLMFSFYFVKWVTNRK